MSQHELNDQKLKISWCLFYYRTSWRSPYPHREYRKLDEINKRRYKKELTNIALILRNILTEPRRCVATSSVCRLLK